MFLLRMSQPLHKARLVHELYTATAFARVVKLVLFRGLPSTNPTGIRFLVLSLLPSPICIVGRVIHYIVEIRGARRFAKVTHRKLHLRGRVDGGVALSSSGRDQRLPSFAGEIFGPGNDGNVHGRG